MSVPDTIHLDTVTDAVAAFGAGELVVVVDDEDRENEGDLICSASTVTDSQIAFMVRYTTGILCAPMDGRSLDRLDISLMAPRNRDRHGTAFTVSVDAREDITTGVSASDRAHTLRRLASPRAEPSDFVQPGHIFPLRARSGGLAERAGHTEAAVDLARLAGLAPIGVLAELVNDDGTMLRGGDLRRFADRHQLRLISIQDLARHASHRV